MPKQHLQNYNRELQFIKIKQLGNLALSKLKQKKLEECKTYLKQIPEDC